MLVGVPEYSVTFFQPNTFSTFTCRYWQCISRKSGELLLTFVEFQFGKLKTNKAVGLDRITVRLLKDSAHIIAPCLAEIFNLSLMSGKFPAILKSGRIIQKECQKKDLLILNVQKSAFILIGWPYELKTCENVNITIHGSSVKRSNSIKYLGIKINEKLSWSDQVEHIIKKCNQRITWRVEACLRSTPSLPLETCLTLYSSYQF